MRKHVIRVFAGSAGAAVITFALTPVLTRIFSPATFGVFASFASVVSLFVGASTLRIEVLAMREPNPSRSEDLMGLSLVVAALWGLVLLVTSAIGVAVFGWSGLWLGLGPTVTVASLELVGVSHASRERAYKRLAVSNFAQGAGTTLIQVLVGLIWSVPAALAFGFGASRLVWIGQLRRRFPRNLGLTWRSTRRNALTAGSSAGINSLAGQAPILLTAMAYGDSSVALLAMGVRILMSPLSILGQATSSVILGEVSLRLREGADVESLVRKGIRSLLAVGFLPTLAAATLAPFLAPIVLGSEWAGTGTTIALLSLGALAQLAVAPFAQILNLTGDSRMLLSWDVLRFIVVVGAFVVPWVLGLPFTSAVASYSVGLLVIYVVLWRLVISAMRSIT